MKVFKLLLFIFFIPAIAFGGVNLKNGNYYISYTDIIVPGGGNDLEVVRTYNSKSTDKGWFGFGWGSDYETYLTVSADGSVVVHENGSGALTRFTPKETVNADAAADKIIEAMRKKTTLTNKVAKNLKKRLLNDAELRQAYSRRFNVKAKLSSGTTLYSNVRGIQKITKIKDGYKRIYNDGKIEEFNEAGNLTKVSDKHGYKLDFNYKNGKLSSIKDSSAKQLFFSWYPDGKVKNIWSAGDKKTAYSYNGDDLVSSSDVAGNTYKFGYDDNHNMTKISYSDKTNMQIKYERKTQFVSEVVDRSSDSTKYVYGSNPKNPEYHYWTTIVKTRKNREPIKSRYEYEIKKRPDGSQYTYRIATDVNNIKTETVYSECCSLPVKITRGKNITNFEYNKKGLLVKKSSNRGDYTELKYHEKLNKITRVVNNDGWTNFSYDKKGNLSKAVNNKSQSVLLIYDRKGRITKMVDYGKSSKKRTLTFKYNALGKPVEIAMNKIGKINVAYDNYGEIKKVESKSGHKMALQVTQAFQSLLSIVKPAGVSLSL